MFGGERGEADGCEHLRQPYAREIFAQRDGLIRSAQPFREVAKCGMTGRKLNAFDRLVRPSVLAGPRTLRGSYVVD